MGIIKEWFYNEDSIEFFLKFYFVEVWSLNRRESVGEIIVGNFSFAGFVLGSKAVCGGGWWCGLNSL